MGPGLGRGAGRACRSLRRSSLRPAGASAAGQGLPSSSYRIGEELLPLYYVLSFTVLSTSFIRVPMIMGEGPALAS